MQIVKELVVIASLAAYLELALNSEELPEGWTSAYLARLGAWATGGTPSRKVSTYFGGEVPWIKSGDLPNGWIESTEESLSTSGLENSSAKVLPARTVSMALYGATIGKLGVFRKAAATNQACANCVVDERIADPWFLFYFLLSQRKKLTEAGQGGAQPNLTNQIVREWPIAIPPLAEQHRIVAKVEGLLARVNAARQRLAKAPAILKRFRQSVLAAACSGRLTADWRENDGDGEGIPSAWQNLELESLLSEPLANGRSVVDAIGSGFPVLRLTALKRGRIDLTERKIGAWSLKEAKPFLVTRGDFLVARGNGSLKLVGRGGLVTDEPDPVAYPDTLIRVRPNKSLMLPEYLAIVWDSPRTRAQIEQAAHTTAGIHKVSQKDLRSIYLPVPPLAEQHEIVRRVEALFKLADAIEKRVAAATARAEKLTQAILAKAFKGELVPTEAELARREGRDYEPASALLERIKDNHAASMVTAKQPLAKRSGKGNRKK